MTSTVMLVNPVRLMVAEGNGLYTTMVQTPVLVTDALTTRSPWVPVMGESEATANMVVVAPEQATVIGAPAPAERGLRAVSTAISPAVAVNLWIMVMLDPPLRASEGAVRAPVAVRAPFTVAPVEDERAIRLVALATPMFVPEVPTRTPLMSI